MLTIFEFVLREKKSFGLKRKTVRKYLVDKEISYLKCFASYHSAVPVAL